MTALVTPFTADGTAVDEPSLSILCESQIAAGIDGLVACGTTGESATLTAREQERVVRAVVEASAGRVPVVAGAGSNSTAHAVELGRAAAAAGADALLAVTPYYNKPNQEGLYQHFKALCGVGLPVILYNVPGRTGCDLLPDTIARLAELPQVVAVKEATGTVQRTQQILAKVGDRLVLLSGEDAINYPLYAVGARGCISVVSNVAPALLAETWDAAAAGDHGRARALHQHSLPLAEALFWEPNPIPVKAALAMMGRMKGALRLPLVPMSVPQAEKLRGVLTAAGLL